MHLSTFIQAAALAVLYFVRSDAVGPQHPRVTPRQNLNFNKNVSELAAAMCGSSHNCFHVPKSDLLVAYRSDLGNASLSFLVVGTKSEWLNKRFPNEDNWALNVGFGRGPEMPNTFIVSCIHDAVERPAVSHVVGAYALYRKVPRRVPSLSRVIRNARVIMNDNTMRCSFTLPKNLSARNDTIDLKAEDLHIKLARTYAAGGCIGFHYVDKHIGERSALFSPHLRSLPAFDFEAYEVKLQAEKNKPDVKNNTASIFPVLIPVQQEKPGPIGNSTGSALSNSVAVIPKRSEVTPQCGVSYACQSLPGNCFNQPDITKIDDQCDVVALYKKSEKTDSGVKVTIVAKKPADIKRASSWYTGFGFSRTPSMEQSIIFVCISDNGNAGHIVPALGYSNTRPDFQPQALDQLVTAQEVVVHDDMMMCQFITKGLQLELNSTVVDDFRVKIDLQQPQHIIMSRGIVANGQVQYHGAPPHRMATQDKFNLLQF